MKSSKTILTRGRHHLSCFSWLFRTNLPPRHGLPFSNDIQRRNFFGIGEIVNVIANPGETVRSLAESRRLLEETRQEMREGRERAQLRPTHTFAPLPGFFPRPAELRAIERALAGVPAFTVLFGASSVGKTALLREVLSRDAYHVLHFDLRIAGFADLGSLYVSLSHQMEQYFESLSKAMAGYEDFEKEAWSFKHDRLNFERSMEKGGPLIVKTSDIARLMELFQSSLLRYWQFEPADTSASSSSNSTKNGGSERTVKAEPSEKRESARNGVVEERRSPGGSQSGRGTEETPEAKEKPVKKIPVVFFDEAHKLPALIRSTEAMKCILDSMLVLTKQDRLCHVIHATSDSFYQTWLRQLNVMQHCKIISIGDCSKTETREYFFERQLPSVPEELREDLVFEELYEAFGGKLAHWADYIADYVNANGDLTVKTSSHFLQAHALLNLQIIYAAEHESRTSRRRHSRARTAASRSPGFRIYSPLPTTAPMPYADTGADGDAGGGSGASAGAGAPAFTALQLLRVMRKLAEPGVAALPYFLLARELGVRAVDDMVRGRLLELRWMAPVSREGGNGAGAGAGGGGGWGGGRAGAAAWVRDSVLGTTSEAGGLAIDGPTVGPTTPIMRYAMREVLREYNLDDEEREGSEYASLSDVDEY